MTSILTVSAETRVNTTTGGAQDYSDVAVLADGSYVVVWEGNGPGDSYGIFYQHFDAKGRPIGAETLVNNATGYDQYKPSVTATGNGGFAISWHSESHDSSGYGIVQSVYTANGDLIAGNMQVNDYATAGQYFVDSALLSNGRQVLVWQSTTQDEGTSTGIYLRLFGGATVVTDEIRVNTTLAGEQTNASVTGLAGGGFVVTWESYGGNGYDVFFQVFNGQGGKVGAESVANQYLTGGQYDSHVTGLADGSFVITWQSADQDGNGVGVYARRFQANGIAIGDEVQVNTATYFDQSAPAIASLSDGGYVIAWQSSQTGTTDIFLQRYDAEGHKIGIETRVNSTTDGAQDTVSISALDDGGFVVTWSSSGQDATGYSVFQKVYGNAASLVGSQLLYGTVESDWLDGGSGGDTMYGGYGDDVYVVNSTGDKAYETFGDGIDEVQASISYTLETGLENLTLTGTSAINGTGNSLANIIVGNKGINVIDGGSGDDELYGEGGNDEIHGGSNEDYIEGGSGNDKLYGDGSADVILGGTGNDRLDGGTNNDTLYGADGNDTFIITTGTDYFYGDAGIDTIDATAATAATSINLTTGKYASTVKAYLFSIENVIGSGFVDTITGTSGDNVLNGMGGVDNISGGDGDDIIDGGTGADTMIGGAGDDTFYVDNAGDIIVENAGEGTDRVFSSATYTLGSTSYVQYLTLTGTSAINATGNNSAQTIIGNTGKNTINGKGGNDTLTGGGGADIFVFSAASGADKITDYSADTINLNAYSHGVTNGGGITITQVGADVKIDMGGGNTITIQDTLKAELNDHIVW